MNYMKATTQQHFFDLVRLRIDVFLIEQNVDANIEIDEYDKNCLHFIAYDNTIPIATCRVIIHDNYGKVGRVCVKRNYRGQNIGLKLMRFIETDEQIKKLDYLILGSQSQVIAFYQKLGYQAYGEPFVEANIEHIMMKKDLC